MLLWRRVSTFLRMKDVRGLSLKHMRLLLAEIFEWISPFVCSNAILSARELEKKRNVSLIRNIS